MAGQKVLQITQLYPFPLYLTAVVSFHIAIYVYALDMMSIYDRRCVSFEKEWIEGREIKEELQQELDEIYGGTVQFASVLCL